MIILTLKKQEQEEKEEEEMDNVLKPKDIKSIFPTFKIRKCESE